MTMVVDITKILEEKRMEEEQQKKDKIEEFLNQFLEVEIDWE